MTTGLEGNVLLRKKMYEKLTEAKTRNLSFSLRAFSKKLQLSPGAVSGILNGKRTVSHALASRILDALLLDPHERLDILKHFRAKASARSRKPGDETAAFQPQYYELPIDQYQLVSEWHHFAILSLLRTSDFRNDPRWIAQRLAITESQARTAVERMLKVGLLQKHPDGTLTRNQGGYRTSDDIPSVCLRKAHANNLELAQASLHRDPVTKRDFTSTTMAIDVDKLPRAKELIRKFQDELAELLEQGNQTEVYKICVQLFPLSQKETSK